MTEQEIEMEGIEKRLRSIELRLSRMEAVLEISENDKSIGFENKILPDFS